MDSLKPTTAKLLMIAVFALSFGVGACKTPGSVKKDSPDADREYSDKDGARDADGNLIDGDVETTDIEEARIRGKEFVPTEDLETVHFNYDAYSISTEARLALRENAAFLKDNPSVEILVEGHCDDRGTNEYNLALGQKRAKAVRDYYMKLGVAGRSIGTITFGEERLSCEEATDACWSQNRRATTKIRAQVSSSQGGEDE
ncbi:MAG: peptidoglycan-associated lipoprotein [Elusimicrobia bacterium]|nr:MAG: peptidoglycan-associated lipoprotein [Elusimicrobiota bacterium]